MRKKLSILLSTTVLTLSAGPFSPAYAEVINQYDPEHTPEIFKEMIEEGDEFYMDSDLLSDMLYEIQGVRLPEANPDDITMRVRNVGMVSGCIKSTPPEIESKRSGKNIRVTIEPSRIIPQNTERQYSLHECKISASTPYADVTFDKEELIEYEVNKITFDIKNGPPILNMKVHTTEDMAAFIVPIKDNLQIINEDLLNGQNKFIHWFYPENTIVLYNPTVTINDRNAEQIVDFARSRGLISLTETFPDFRTNKLNKDKMYFVDVDGAYISQLEGQDDVETLGTIEFGETYYGAEGKYEKMISKPIYAKRPGLYD